MKRMQVHTGAVLATIVFLSAGAWAEGYYIEAESVSPVSPWVRSTSKSGYSGSCYYEWTGGDTRSTTRGVLAYEFTIKQPGNYVVTLRGRRDQDGVCAGAASDLCNDVFSKMNSTGTWCKTMIKGTWGQWIWQSRIAECGDLTMQPMKFTLKAGKNTFYVCGRSKGMKFDALTVHLDGTARPTSGTTRAISAATKGTSTRNREGSQRFDIRGRSVRPPIAVSNLSQPSGRGVYILSDGARSMMVTRCSLD